jgi:hypothetical protein
MKNITGNILAVFLVLTISGFALSREPRSTAEDSIEISEFRIEVPNSSNDLNLAKSNNLETADCVDLSQGDGLVTVSGRFQCHSKPKEPIEANIDSQGVLEILDPGFKNKGKGKGKGLARKIMIPPSKHGYEFSYDARVPQELLGEIGGDFVEITLTATGKRTRVRAESSAKLYIRCQNDDDPSDDSSGPIDFGNIDPI